MKHDSYKDCVAYNPGDCALQAFYNKDGAEKPIIASTSTWYDLAQVRLPNTKTMRFKGGQQSYNFLLINANNSTATTVLGDSIKVRYGYMVDSAVPGSGKKSDSSASGQGIAKVICLFILIFIV